MDTLCPSASVIIGIPEILAVNHDVFRRVLNRVLETGRVRDVNHIVAHCRCASRAPANQAVCGHPLRRGRCDL